VHASEWCIDVLLFKRAREKLIHGVASCRVILDVLTLSFVLITKVSVGRRQTLGLAASVNFPHSFDAFVDLVVCQAMEDGSWGYGPKCDVPYVEFENRFKKFN